MGSNKSPNKGALFISLCLLSAGSNFVELRAAVIGLIAAFIASLTFLISAKTLLREALSVEKLTILVSFPITLPLAIVVVLQCSSLIIYLND